MALEDFTTYTEADPNNHIDLVGTDHIDFDAYLNEDAWLYKDKGIDHFGDFEHKIDIRPISATADYVYGDPWVLSNDIDDVKGLDAATKTFLRIELGHWTEAYPKIRLSECDAGTYYDHYYDAAYNTWYYLTIKKAGTAFTCKIYSDATRETLLDTLSLTLHADYKFQYIFAADTFNAAGDRTFVMDIENLDLQEAPPPAARSFGYIIG